VNTIFEIVCWVKHELLETKYFQASEIRGCQSPLQLPNLSSLYTSQTSPNGTPAIEFPDRVSGHPGPKPDL
jgi:hypothetical protein